MLNELSSNNACTNVLHTPLATTIIYEGTLGQNGRYFIRNPRRVITDGSTGQPTPSPFFLPRTMQYLITDTKLDDKTRKLTVCTFLRCFVYAYCTQQNAIHTEYPQTLALLESEPMIVTLLSPRL